MIEIENKTPEVEPQAVFGDSASIEPCSFHKCKNGHSFPVIMTLIQCPECRTHGLMVKMVNCPYCNEPVEKTTVRTDFLPKGAGMAKRCSGEMVYGESMNVELERRYTQEIEGNAQEAD